MNMKTRFKLLTPLFLVISILLKDDVVKADPFTYQNDLRVVQMNLVNILTGANANACATAASPIAFSVSVTFAQAFASVPQVAVSVVDVKGTNQNIVGFSVNVPTGTITTSGFQISVACQQSVAANQLVTLQLQYVATILSNVLAFSKTYSSTTLAPLSTGSLYRYINDQITLSTPATQIPKVYAFVTGFILTKGADKRFVLKAEVSSISLTQFTLTLSTNLLCYCTYAQVQFLAFWATETSDNLLPTQPNNVARQNPLTYPFWGFYSDYLNTNQTAISVFYGVSQFDLGTFNPTTPLLGPDIPLEVQIQAPTFTGNQYLFQVGSNSGTRNYETFVPWVIFLLKRCPTNEYLFSNYLCSTLCPFNTYKQTVNLVGICSPCDVTCQECSGPNANQCTSCAFPSRTLSSGTCNCSNGYYQGTTPQTLCQLCSYKCDTCLNALDNCTSCNANRLLATNCNCPSGTWDQGVFEICPSCYRTCSACVNGDQNKCTTCKTGYSLVNGSCVCPTGYYDDITKNACSACHSSCATCNGGTNQDCVTCSATLNRQLVQGNQCLCMLGYYESNSVCLQDPKITCVPYCATCQDTSICLVCQTGRSLVANACICPDGQYHNYATQLCTTCYTACKTCTGGSQYECTSCNTGRSLSNGMCNSISQSNDSNLNVALLSIICVLVVLLIIVIPYLMRWTYYLSKRIWLRKRALAEFVQRRAKDREERIQNGQGDVIVHDPIILTENGDESIAYLDQSILNGSIILQDPKLNGLKTPQKSHQLSIYNNNNYADPHQIQSPSNNPHMQVLSPHNTSMAMINGADARSPQASRYEITSPSQNYNHNGFKASQKVYPQQQLFDPYANAGSKRLPKLNL